MKKCSKCKLFKFNIFFNKNKTTKDGLQSYCKSCHKKWTHENKDKIAKHFRTKYKRHKIKILAQHELKAKVKSGEIKRPTKCSICNKHDNNIHGHHDDYSKPLNVVWCCDKCHKKIHKKLDNKK